MNAVSNTASTLVAPRTRDLGLLADQLSRWLARKMPHARDIAIANLTYPSGAGMSHETILFDAQWIKDGEKSSQGLVVRVKPVDNMVFPDDLFENQYRIMRFMHARGEVPIAEPLWLENDPAVIGAPFFMMKRAIGRVPVSRPPYAEVGWLFEATPAQRATAWESGVRTLAAIHRTPTDELDFLAGPNGGLRGLDQEWDKYVRFVEWISVDQRWPVLDAALEALRARWPANQPQGLAWGGAEMVNMMFDEDFKVVAVMDWEQPSLGGPLNDLAWWLVLADLKHGESSGRPWLEGIGTREQTIELWSELSGLSAADIEWYEDFMAFKMRCMSVSTSRIWGVVPPDQTPLAKRLNLQIAP